MKAQKEQALTETIKEMEISKDDEARLRAILENAEGKGKELKNDTTLTDEQKAEKNKHSMQKKVAN